MTWHLWQVCFFRNPWPKLTCSPPDLRLKCCEECNTIWCSTTLCIIFPVCYRSSWLWILQSLLTQWFTWLCLQNVCTSNWVKSLDDVLSGKNVDMFNSICQEKLLGWVGSLVPLAYPYSCHWIDTHIVWYRLGELIVLGGLTLGGVFLIILVFLTHTTARLLASRYVTLPSSPPLSLDAWPFRSIFTLTRLFHSPHCLCVHSVPSHSAQYPRYYRMRARL